MVFHKDNSTNGLNNDDPFWFKDAIIYELHVKAFFDSADDGIGDFKGLTQKLDYLEELGVNTLWLLPFYPSPFRDDGYDISDYRGLHPQYGTLKDFRIFLREAHRRGLRVLTELVVNHTSDQHRWFQAAQRAKPNSVKRNYYVWSDSDKKYSNTRIIFCDTEKSNWTWDPLAQAYYWHRFYHHQPDLNLNNPRVVQEVVKIMRYWLDMGVDGFRLDAVPYLCVCEGTSNENLPETHQVIKQFRTAIDRRYRGKILLAEANQWPEDVRPYFAQGDECHMAFHFPLMPRVFMALCKEDRTPIVDIMQRTPEIPDNCQWAVFLRNHDELTLEMVSEDERDYMYRQYAVDPRMRLNLGIRRRLAPLVENSLRRLELLNSFLFSFPGSPVIYYGDEIGMGDNIFLGDRDSVRTPMQWSSDRNAGFSRADPARLYLPLVMDPVYGYQTVNVEAQERSPSSVLNFMKRLIALRRQYKAFARGTLEFLQPKNKKILAYLRRYYDEIILCVANLSRHSQPAEIDLSRFDGWVLMELFGRTEFLRISSQPYFFTLGPHSFYWFRLEQAVQPLELSLPEEKQAEQPPTIMMEAILPDFLQQKALRPEMRDVIAAYITKQHWFHGKLRQINSLKIADTTTIGSYVHLVTVNLTYDDQKSESYFLPLRVASGPAANRLARKVPHKVVALIKTPTTVALLLDAMYDPRSCQLLLAAIHHQREFTTSLSARIAGHHTGFIKKELRKKLTLSAVRAIETPQRSTAVVFGEKLILKLHRLLSSGLSPELELTRCLTEQGLFFNFPRSAGWLQSKSSEGETSILASLEEFIPNDEDAWSFALTLFDKYFASVSSKQTETYTRQFHDQSLKALVASADFAPVVPPLAECAKLAETLGKLTAEFHICLAGNCQDPRFAPQPVTADYLEVHATEVLRKSGSAVKLLSRRLHEVPENLRNAAQTFLNNEAMVSESIRSIESSLKRACAAGQISALRCHNDLHLGQFLKQREEFYIFDFEGDPTQPLEERIRKHAPQRDLASLLFSFSSAVYTSLSHQAESIKELKDIDSLLNAASLLSKTVSVYAVRGYLAVLENKNITFCSADNFFSLFRLFCFESHMLNLEQALTERLKDQQIFLLAAVDLILAEVKAKL